MALHLTMSRIVGPGRIILDRTVNDVNEVLADVPFASRIAIALVLRTSAAVSFATR